MVVLPLPAPPWMTTTPLPDAGTEVHTPALDLHVPMRIGYDALERALADHFRLESGGVRYPATGRRFIRPTHITLYGYGSAIVVRDRGDEKSQKNGATTVCADWFSRPA